MNESSSFSPLGVAVAVTAPNGSASASTTLPGAGGTSAMVTNGVNAPISLGFATVAGGAAATATSFVIGPSQTRVVGIPTGTTDVSVWGIGATGTVYVQRGDGL